jgi:hypothetical protein
MTCESPSYLALSAQYMWTDTHFLYIRIHFSNYAKNIRRHHIKISLLSAQPHGIYVFLVYAPGVMPYFVFNFSKSKKECRRVSVHFRSFAFQKSGIIRLAVLITYFSYTSIVNSKQPNERKGNARVTGKGSRHFSVNVVHPPKHTNTGWNFSSILQFGEIPRLYYWEFWPQCWNVSVKVA